MIEYIFVGLISGMIVFFLFFLVSFVTLALIAGFVRLITALFCGIGFDRSITCQEQSA